MKSIIPDITDRFTYNGESKNRCKGYLREVTREEALSGLDESNITSEILIEFINESYDEMQENDQIKVKFCSQHYAQYVSGAGGVIAHISKVTQCSRNEAFIDCKDEMIEEYEKSLDGHLAFHTFTISKR